MRTKDEIEKMLTNVPILSAPESLRDKLRADVDLKRHVKTKNAIKWFGIFEKSVIPMSANKSTATVLGILFRIFVST